MSPPLVVAFALAGRVDIVMNHDPIGKDKSGTDVFLKDLWPTLREVRDLMQAALQPEVFRKLYKDFAGQNPKWNKIPSSTGNVYEWDRKSTYIQEPPFFTSFSLQPGSIAEIKHRRAGALHFRRQRDDRSHFARRFHQENFARRKISRRERRDGGGFQQLRRASRTRRRHDSRNVRERPHQKSHGARHRGRRDEISAGRRAVEHLRRGHKISGGENSARHPCRTGIRHRLQSRELGRERHEPCSA